MADTFGNPSAGRAFDGGKFYAIPAADVAANAIYCPHSASSGRFGVAEHPVKSGELGSFSTHGIFLFEKPNGWISVSGRAVYYSPMTISTGTIKASATTADLFIGYEVTAPNIPSDKIAIDVFQKDLPVAAASDATNNPKQSNISALTPSGSGTASDTLAASTETNPTAADFDNLSATIAVKINAILDLLEDAGLMDASN